MTAQDYKLIAMSVWRAGYVPDQNKVRQAAKEKVRHLIAVDLAASLAVGDPSFDQERFLRDCGFVS